MQQKDKNILVNWLDSYIDKFLDEKTEKIDEFVEKFREENPDLSNLQLTKKLRNKKSLNNGFVGAVAGVGGLLTLPVTIPADLVATWRIQIALIYAIAHIFGFSNDKHSLKTDIYLILAGKQADEIMEELGIDTLKEVTKKAVQKHLFRELSGRILIIVPQKIIIRATEKSVSHFMKLVPLAGAPFGFAFDYFDTRKVGSIAIKYFNV